MQLRTAALLVCGHGQRTDMLRWPRMGQEERIACEMALAVSYKDQAGSVSKECLLKPPVETLGAPVDL